MALEFVSYFEFHALIKYFSKGAPSYLCSSVFIRGFHFPIGLMIAPLQSRSSR